MKIVLATGNRGKRREITAFFDGMDIGFLSLDDFPDFKPPPETGRTFAENALAKARAVCAFTALPALADDSGLEVDYLGNAPGIYSARYASAGSSGAPGPGTGTNSSDDDNIDRLLRELEGVPEEKRGARFCCAVALVLPACAGSGAVEEHTFSGRLEGRITGRRVCAGGFGYDPVFFIPSLGVAASELSVEGKGAISHRGAALKGLKKWLEGSGLV